MESQGVDKKGSRWSNNTLSIIATLAAVAQGMGALFGQTNTWSWFSREVALPLSAVLLLAGLALALYSRKAGSIALLGSGMALVITGTAAIGALWATSSRFDSPLDYPRVEAKFNPRPRTVNFCSSYGGTGVIPGGFEVMIFDRPSDDPQQGFAVHGDIEKTENGWVSKSIGLGDNPSILPDRSVGLPVELHAQLVDEAEYKALMGVIAVDSSGKDVKGGSFKVTTLPGVPLDVLNVVRGAGQGDPGC